MLKGVRGVHEIECLVLKAAQKLCVSVLVIKTLYGRSDGVAAETNVKAFAVTVLGEVIFAFTALFCLGGFGRLVGPAKSTVSLGQ